MDGAFLEAVDSYYLSLTAARRTREGVDEILTLISRFCLSWNSDRRFGDLGLILQTRVKLEGEWLDNETRQNIITASQHKTNFILGLGYRFHGNDDNE